MSADILHHGHLNIVREAARFGSVMIGLLTDRAIASYKRRPIFPYSHRKLMIENIRGVDCVVPQFTLDYRRNLRKYRPRYVIHGDDWTRGPQREARRRVLDTLAEWDGELIEVHYTRGVSTTQLIHHIRQRLIDDGPG